MGNHIHDQINRRNKLKSARARLDDYCQDLAEIMHPDRAEFTTTRTRHSRDTRTNYDGTPQQARRSLANAIDSLIKPKADQWFKGRPDDEGLADDDAVKRWFEVGDDRMRIAIYNRNARFIQRSGEVDNDLVTFGFGYLFVGENRDRNGLLFRSIHPRDGLIAENDAGVVDTIFVTQHYTVRQAMQRWGEENLGDKAKESIRTEKWDDEFEYVWIVQPRKNRDRRRKDNRAMPFSSEVIEVASEHRVMESGFHEFPFAVPRWGGGLYGWSPGTVALSDAQTLRAMGKTLLVGGQRAVDPPQWQTSDGVLSPVRTFPGGITVIDARSFREAGGRPPIGQLTAGAANIPLGREMQQDTREQVWGAFFRNLIQLPIDRPEMTATEVLERRADAALEVGPVFGQMESDYTGQIIERVWAIMMRAEAFPPPPDVLRNTDFHFEFENPVHRARKQKAAAGFARSMDLLAPLALAQPEIMDNFDGDEIARDMPDSIGYPERWLRPIDVRDARRDAHAQAQRGMETMQNLQMGADIAQKGVPALQQLMGPQQGAARA